ncbi:hypothetical protein OUZ56_021591 [Daphnia magna]|uniref:Uncharacterized protein n=1 Tax=Daphnia magna TaxID=35525 RepID=A0ABR0ATX7_9CRUS|nr:hypothetical protein OUZ56_021591 [Daphnia magna]
MHRLRTKRAKSGEEMMVELHESRLEAGAPRFTRSACHLFGPMEKLVASLSLEDFFSSYVDLLVYIVTIRRPNQNSNETDKFHQQPVDQPVDQRGSQ